MDIYRIRRHLGWPRERFDAVLCELKRDYAVQLHGGDPSNMTEQELRDALVSNAIRQSPHSPEQLDQILTWADRVLVEFSILHMESDWLLLSTFARASQSSMNQTSPCAWTSSTNSGLNGLIGFVGIPG